MQPLPSLSINTVCNIQGIGRATRVCDARSPYPDILAAWWKGKNPFSGTDAKLSSKWNYLPQVFVVSPLTHLQGKPGKCKLQIFPEHIFDWVLFYHLIFYLWFKCGESIIPANPWGSAFSVSTQASQGLICYAGQIFYYIQDSWCIWCLQIRDRLQAKRLDSSGHLRASSSAAF